MFIIAKYFLHSTSVTMTCPPDTCPEIKNKVRKKWKIITKVGNKP
jgi:hypothetical protein